MRRHFAPALAALLVLVPLHGYVRSTTSQGEPFFRSDVTNIRFLINDQTAAGMTNTGGTPIITADSDPTAALRSSVATWNGIPTSEVRFADLQTTPLTDADDNQHIIIFTDTQEHRDDVGTALAITSTIFNPATGEITDTDIIFNPDPMSRGSRTPFSTNLAPGTFDLESTATHELGHALGLNHTIFLGATMYQSSPPARNFQAQLSTDDIAFANAAYPANGQQDNFGSLTGTIRDTGGLGLAGAFVTAIEVNAFRHVSALTGIVGPGANSFSYTMEGMTPGTYMVFVEPMNGPVFPGNVQLNPNQVNTDFHTTAWGGFANPNTIIVPAAGTSFVDVDAEPGASAIDILRVGDGPVGNDGNAGFGQSARLLNAGEAKDLIFWGPGIDGTTTENDIHIFASGVTMRPGTLHIDGFLPLINGNPPLRFTVDVAATAATGLGTVVIAKNGDAAAWTGGLVIRQAVVNPVFTAAGLVNAATFTAGNVPPDAWMDLFGENLANRFLLDGNFPFTLDGTSISIIDSQSAEHAARIHFVSPTRVQFITPPMMASGPATLRLTNSTGGRTEIAINVAQVAPGLFTANASGQGPAAATYLRVLPDNSRIDGILTFTLDLPPNRANDPIRIGADQIFISFFGTGFRNQSSVECRIDGVPIPVLGAVPQGQFEALDQAVVGPIPASFAGRRNVTVAFTFDGIPTNPVTVSFQ